MNKSYFICFTGIDGSGKTTVARKCVENLYLIGYNAKYVYCRYVPILTRPVLIVSKSLFYHKENFFQDYSHYSNRKKETAKKYPYLAILYQKLLIFDYKIQIFFKVIVPLTYGKIIICDRYYYDTIVTDLAIDFGYTQNEIIKAFGSFAKCPEPDLKIFIDVPEIIAYSRKNDIPSIQYLIDRRESYVMIANLKNMITIDGTQSIDKIHNIATELVLARLHE